MTAHFAHHNQSIMVSLYRLLKIMKRRCTWGVLYLVACLTTKGLCEDRKPKIAIVGGGIGGTSTAYFLSSLFGSDGTTIDVYERQHVGGRLATAEVDGRLFETGGSAIHPKNRYMRDFINNLGLPKRHVFGIRLGLFDGQQYLLMDGNRPVSAFGKLFHRYGNSMSDFHTVTNDFLKRFVRVYDVQENGFAFTNVKKLLEAVDPLMVNLTQVTARQYLLEQGLIHAFINEICSGIVRICYGQTPDVNGFVGVTSLAGAQAGLFGVLGGNEKIPHSLIKQSKSNLIWADVQRIELNKDDQYDVFSRLVNENVTGTKDNGTQLKTYDMVIVTTPMIKDVSEIQFSGFPHEIVTYKGQYSPSVITLVSGKLNISYLGMYQSYNRLDEILTTKDNSFFKALMRVYPVDIHEEISQSSEVFKVISEHPLKDDELDLIFSERKSVKMTSWFGSPRYMPPQPLETFVLHPGLFYTSAIDWVASTIEMSSISGKNAALLAYYHWHRQNSRVDSFPAFHTEL